MANTNGRIGRPRTAKHEVDDVTSKMAQKADVDHQFGEVTEQLERIEKLMLADHKRRIERLKTEMKDLRDMLAVE
jgi:archaellum component FlaC